MGYTGNTTPHTGSDTTNELTRDVNLGVIESFQRRTPCSPLLWTQSIEGGTGAQFIIEGKEDIDNTNVAEYTAGAQVDVTDGSQDEVVINLDRPQYVARRVDKWKEATANYNIIAMQVRQMGSKLGAAIERKALSAVETSSLTTGLVGNGDGTVVVNDAMPGGASASTAANELGNAICDAIYDGAAAVRANDDESDIYCVLSPQNYSYVVRSDRAINKDFVADSNGGYDMGEVKMVGNVVIIQSNDVPVTANLVGLMFTQQSAGIVNLMGLQTKIGEQQAFLDAKLITSYYANGMGALRPQSSVSLKSA